jgi:hypothetical protein
MHGKVICHAHCPGGARGAALGVLAAMAVLGLFVAAHLVLVAVVLGMAGLLAGGLAVLSRVLRSCCVVVGAERLRRRTDVPAAVPVPAIAHRAPLAIEPPRVFVAGEVVSEPAEVVINGTRYPVLRKR